MTDDVERRLRSALGARAGQITQDSLRFGVPPTVAVPARSFPFAFLPWLVALSGVAIVAVVLGFTLRLGQSDTAPIQPVAPPPPAVVESVTPSVLSPPVRPSRSSTASASASSGPATESTETSPTGSEPAVPVTPPSKPSAESTSPSALPRSTPPG